jgi:hypothetical protein
MRAFLPFVLLLSALALPACQGDETCNSWAGSYGRASWGECGDHRDRMVSCDVIPALGTPPPAPGTAVKCICSLGGVVGKSFEMIDPVQLGTIDSATRTANEQCGWNVGR